MTISLPNIFVAFHKRKVASQPSNESGNKTMKQTAGVARAYRRSRRCSGRASADGLLKYLFFAAFAAALSASAAANGGALIDLKAPVASWDDGIPLGNGGEEGRRQAQGDIRQGRVRNQASGRPTCPEARARALRQALQA